MNSHDYRLNPNVNQEWIACDNCRSYMVPLDKYEIEEGTVGLPDWSDTGLLGLWHSVAGFLFGTLFGTAWASVVDKRRRSKLEKLKSEILPQHPQSQVCPQCLHVRRLP